MLANEFECWHRSHAKGLWHAEWRANKKTRRTNWKSQSRKSWGIYTFGCEINCLVICRPLQAQPASFLTNGLREGNEGKVTIGRAIVVADRAFKLVKQADLAPQAQPVFKRAQPLVQCSARGLPVSRLPASCQTFPTGTTWSNC